jgi:hypothetical protein
LKMHLQGGIAPSSQTEGSLLIPLASKASWENDLRVPPMGATNSKI